ncbi:DUF4446 family protein [Clostridium subterminale]|uniref:DUF4446 family protein n=1 Tax=Clostridium TaxID=1485 RepID=UPI0031D656E7
MEQIIEFLNQYNVFITIGLIILVFVLIIIVITSLISTSKMKDKYRKMMKGTNNKNLEELIINSLDKIENVEEITDEVKDMCNKTSNIVASCVQRVAMQRYKAFEDIGSDLSYSIALLDGRNNGVIITSIYSRNESITYAKPIDNGISRYDLSQEENNVLHQAVNTNKE